MRRREQHDHRENEELHERLQRPAPEREKSRTNGYSARANRAQRAVSTASRPTSTTAGDRAWPWALMRLAE